MGSSEQEASGLSLTVSKLVDCQPAKLGAAPVRPRRQAGWLCYLPAAVHQLCGGLRWVQSGSTGAQGCLAGAATVAGACACSEWGCHRRLVALLNSLHGTMQLGHTG